MFDTMNPRSRRSPRRWASHARVAELADAQDLGSCAARREGSSPSSRIQPTPNDIVRLEAVKHNRKPSSILDHGFVASRQNATDPDTIRPPTATQNATHVPVATDPDLAIVVDS